MSLPPAPLPALATSIAINPLEHAFMAINTNPYFIGLMMLLLNLGGRFLGMEISKEQEKIFQNPWVRRALVFTVLFVATRNIFVAGIMTIFVLILLSFLLNENSELCLWKDSCATNPAEEGTMTPGLTPEETEIWRRLNEKQMRMAAAHQKKQDSEEDVMSVDNIYASNLTKLIS
jgi:hypothetical protein